jgi:hypothetical protein
MVWLYVTVALAVAGAAMALGSLAGNELGKSQVAGWVCVMAGACFVVAHLLAGGHGPLLLVIGWTCWIAGVLAFVIPRRHAGAGWRP